MQYGRTTSSACSNRSEKHDDYDDRGTKKKERAQGHGSQEAQMGCWDTRRSLPELDPVCSAALGWCRAKQNVNMLLLLCCALQHLTRTIEGWA